MMENKCINSNCEFYYAVHTCNTWLNLGSRCSALDKFYMDKKLKEQPPTTDTPKKCEASIAKSIEGESVLAGAKGRSELHDEVKVAKRLTRPSQDLQGHSPLWTAEQIYDKLDSLWCESIAFNDGMEGTKDTSKEATEFSNKQFLDAEMVKNVILRCTSISNDTTNELLDDLGLNGDNNANL